MRGVGGVPRISDFSVGKLPFPDALPPLGGWANASSSQIIINGWLVYDPTTGPVLPPAAPPPVVLLDDTQFRRLRGKTPLSPTNVPIAIPIARICPLLDEPKIRRLSTPKALAETSAPVGVVTGQFLPNFVVQWGEHTSIVRQKVNGAAGASSTSEATAIVAAVTSAIAFESASTITITGWSFYDATTGPVLPPAPPPPVVLPDEALGRRLRGKSLPQETSAPTFVSPISPIPLADGTKIQRLAGLKPLAETSAPIGTASGQFLPNFIAQWGEHQRPTKLRPNPLQFDQAAAPLFPPAAPVTNFVAQWLGQSEPSRIQWNKAAFASATLDAIKVDGQFLPNFVAQWGEHQRPTKVRPNPIQFDQAAALLFQPLAAVATPVDFWYESLDVPLKIRYKGQFADSVQPIFPPTAPVQTTFVGSSSSQLIIHRWSIHDQTAGPVSPPEPIAPPPVVLSDATAFRSPVKKWLPLQTSIVIAIPVDDLWFESLDVPVRIKTKGRLAESVQPIFPPAAPAPVFAAQWIGQSEPLRIRWNKATSASSTIDPIKVAGQFLPNFLPQWGEQPRPTKVRANPAQFDQAAQPVLPPSAPAAIFVSHWLGQSEPVRIRWNRADWASSSIDPVNVAGQFLPNFVAQWGEHPRPEKRRPNPLQFDPTTQPLFPPAAPATVFVSHWLGQSEPGRIKWNKADWASATIDPIKVAGQFLPNFVAQWIGQSEPSQIRWNKAPWASAAIDQPIFLPAPPVPVFASQWIGQSEPSQIRWNKAPWASATIDPIRVAGQFIPNFLPQWGELAPLSRIKWNKSAHASATIDPIRVTGQFLPNFVSQWIGQSEPTRIKWNKAQFASATQDPIKVSGQFQPNFLAQWDQYPSLTPIKWNKAAWASSTEVYLSIQQRLVVPSLVCVGINLYPAMLGHPITGAAISAILNASNAIDGDPEIDAAVTGVPNVRKC